MVFFTFFIFGPLQELSSFIIVKNETKISMENFSKLLAAKSEYKSESPVAIGDISNLEFSNVSFKHKSTQNYAVEDINFQIKQGETVAFVGPSGSGKTTLVKLLVGLYPPAEGEIKYNGINSKDRFIRIEKTTWIRHSRCTAFFRNNKRKFAFRNA